MGHVNLKVEVPRIGDDRMIDRKIRSSTWVLGDISTAELLLEDII
jgi:hypothetical protein